MREHTLCSCLEKSGVPDIRGVWSHVPGPRQFTAVAIKQRYPGHAKQPGLIASQCFSGDPMIHPDSKVRLNSRAVIEACRPYQWIDNFPKVAETSPELRRKCLQNSVVPFSDYSERRVAAEFLLFWAMIRPASCAAY